MTADTLTGDVLVVDDDAQARGVLVDCLTRSGYRVVDAPDAEQAIIAAHGRRFDLLMTDLMMPGQDGIGLLGELVGLDPELVGIVMTGYGSIESAVKAMKTGAFDYLTKPFNLSEVEVVVRRAMQHRTLRRENDALKKELGKKRGFDSLLGNSQAMRGVTDLIGKVADTEATVLITGESGTGKEVAARAVHNRSGRAGMPMIAVNCGAIPEELLESELFGHEKGAFSGATHTRIGRFEMAHGGSILLDEIGDMSHNLQAKLLRVLQEREFERVGGEKTIKVDVRVMAATHRDLDRLVEERRFRADLYYRLNVIQVKLPPLRDRLEDLPVLVSHFIGKHGGKKGDGITGVTPDAMGVLESYPWPGNVRELENVVERACILKDGGAITREDLPEKLTVGPHDGAGFLFRLPTTGIDFNKAVERFEADLINQALERSGGVKNRAARLLGLGRTTLVEKIKKKKLAATG